MKIMMMMMMIIMIMMIIIIIIIIQFPTQFCGIIFILLSRSVIYQLFHFFYFRHSSNKALIFELCEKISLITNRGLNSRDMFRTVL